jgi:Fur family ferric uptake transcriptional regulator
MNKADALIDQLQKKGKRITDTRRVLLGILSAHSQPLSVPALLAAMKKRNLTPNKTTIYRELEHLRTEGIIREVLIDGKVQHVELLNEDDHHHHLICTKCKRVEDIDPPADIEKKIDELTRLVQRKTSFASISHAVDFFGICKACA